MTEVTTTSIDYHRVWCPTCDLDRMAAVDGGVDPFKDVRDEEAFAAGESHARETGHLVRHRLDRATTFRPKEE